MVDSVIEQSSGDNWQIYNADCVEAVGNLPDDSVGFSVFSPPFASLYTYSNSDRDMGNCSSYDEFWEQFVFLIDQLYRAMKPGRCVSVHCMNIQTTKTHHGYIGMQDFRGDIIRRFQKSGFIYHSEVCIWKDPVIAMQRTKAIGLLHKQLCKDSCMSRQGIPDYVCTFRKPGENPEPVAGELDYFAGDQSTFKVTGRLSIDVWQRYASPIWTDINPSNTLQYTTARDEEDERHICPLQLDVIERCVQLWSNEGDVVLSPFCGIGSEGHVAINTGRKFVGVELKPSYYRIACKNLNAAVDSNKEQRLF
jgi:DNA modification methylase